METAAPGSDTDFFAGVASSTAALSELSNRKNVFPAEAEAALRKRLALLLKEGVPRYQAYLCELRNAYGTLIQNTPISTNFDKDTLVERITEATTTYIELRGVRAKKGCEEASNRKTRYVPIGLIDAFPTDGDKFPREKQMEIFLASRNRDLT
jgi:hypothetical protein